MFSIKSNKHTGLLETNFRYKKQSCVEPSDLVDTIENRRHLARKLRTIQNQILYGSFDYAVTFPNSARFGKVVSLNTLGSNSDSKVPLFVDGAVEWYQTRQLGSNWKSTPHIRSSFIKHFYPFFGEMQMDKITSADIREFTAKLYRLEDENGDPIGADAVTRHIVWLIELMHYASVCYKFPSPEFDKGQRYESTDPKPLSLSEVKVFLQNVREDFRDYYLIRFLTGMRSSEINGLKWKHIDFNSKLIAIKEVTINGLSQQLTDDSVTRHIQMSSPVFMAFERLKEKSDTDIFVFSCEQNHPFAEFDVSKDIWHPCLIKSGLDTRVSNQTRHTAAVLWLASGENPDWVAEQMGVYHVYSMLKDYSKFAKDAFCEYGARAEKHYSDFFVM